MGILRSFPSDISRDSQVLWLPPHFLTNCTNCTNCTAMYGSHQGSSCRLMLKHLLCSDKFMGYTRYTGTRVHGYTGTRVHGYTGTREKGTTGPSYLCLQ